MPGPQDGESREQFLDRCMADPEAISSHPDPAQRFAVCSSSWDRRVSKLRQASMLWRLSKADEDQRIAWGWFSVIEVDGKPVVDAQGDVIDLQTLVDAAHGFITESRAAKVMHAGRNVGRVVESVVFTKDLQEAMGIDLGMVGWFGAMKFEDDDAWARVKAGELRAFSFGGTGLRKWVTRWRSS